MSVLFKDLTANMPIYALVKGDTLKFHEGSIVSVGQQRVEMPQMQAGQMQMPSMKNVVDVTYSLDGKNYTDVVDITACMFPTEKTGAITLVATDKDAIVRELHATLKKSEGYITEAEKRVPAEKKRIGECKELIAALDTDYKERQETEQRFTKLEKVQEEQGSKLDEILKLLRKE